MKKFTLYTTLVLVAFGFIVTGCEEEAKIIDPTVITITGITGNNGNRAILTLHPTPESQAVAITTGIINNGTFSEPCVKNGEVENWQETGEYYILLKIGNDTYFYASTQDTAQKYNIRQLHETIGFSNFKKRA